MFFQKCPLFLFDSGLVPKFYNLFLLVSADSFAHPALWCERNVTVTYPTKLDYLLPLARTRAYTQEFVVFCCHICHRVWVKSQQISVI